MLDSGLSHGLVDLMPIGGITVGWASRRRTAGSANASTTAEFMHHSYTTPDGSPGTCVGLILVMTSFMTVALLKRSFCVSSGEK
jgi:hypothetical protein